MVDDARRAALIASAQRIGANPLDYATVMSYETGGTFNPAIRGGAGNRHIGLIQFGPNEQKQFGAHQKQSFEEQLPAVEGYLTTRGFKPGMGILDMYSTINAGSPGRYNASDANNGGAPGTVADKVNNQFAPHRAKAAAFLGGDFTPTMPGEAPAVSGQFAPSGPQASARAAAPMQMPAEAPAAAPSFNAASFLQAVMGGGSPTMGASAQAAPQAQPQAAQFPDMLGPIGGQAQPFDAQRFYDLLMRKRV